MVMSGCRIGRKCRSSDAYSMIDYYSRMPRHVRKGCKCKRQRSLSFHPPQTGSLLYKSGRLLVSVPSQSLRMSKTTNALFCYGLNPFTCLFGSSTRPNTSIEECDTPFPLKKKRPTSEYLNPVHARPPSIIPHIHRLSTRPPKIHVDESTSPIFQLRGNTHDFHPASSSSFPELPPAASVHALAPTDRLGPDVRPPQSP